MCVKGTSAANWSSLLWKQYEYFKKQQIELSLVQQFWPLVSTQRVKNPIQKRQLGCYVHCTITHNNPSLETPQGSKIQVNRTWEMAYIQQGGFHVRGKAREIGWGGSYCDKLWYWNNVPKKSCHSILNQSTYKIN